MPRPILTTALLAASLALAVPTLAAPKTAKPAAAQTHPQGQPENVWDEFQRSQNKLQQIPNIKLQPVKHLKAKNLIDEWLIYTETDEGISLHTSIIDKNHTGTNVAALSIRKTQSRLTIRQQFTWQFNEKTQTFTQRITDFATSENDAPFKQDPSKIGKTITSKARLLRWDGKPDMLELTDQASGEKQIYFKLDIDEPPKTLN